MTTKKTVFTVDGITVAVERKKIKSIRLRVCPPEGQVKLSAPYLVPDSVLRSFVAARMDWIRRSVAAVVARAKEQGRASENGDCFMLWGLRYPLKVSEKGSRYHLEISNGEALFTVPKNSTAENRASRMQDFYREALTKKVNELLPLWEKKTGLYASGFSLRDMTSRWGTCNTRTGHILLNLQLAKRPPVCLEYVILHELAHLKVAAHNADFYAILDEHMPGWKQIKKELNGR